MGLVSGVTCQESHVTCLLLHGTSFSQAVGDKDLKFLKKDHFLSPDTCHMSCVTFSITCVMCHMSFICYLVILRHFWPFVFKLNYDHMLFLLPKQESILISHDFTHEWGSVPFPPRLLPARLPCISPPPFLPTSPQKTISWRPNSGEYWTLPLYSSCLRWSPLTIGFWYWTKKEPISFGIVFLKETANQLLLRPAGVPWIK